MSTGASKAVVRPGTSVLGGTTSITEDLRERLALGLALEETLAGERLPEHDGRGVDVDGAREVASRELLGRHVRELALDLALARRLDAARGLRDAEVEHARDAVGADEDVLRRHVAVHDAERLAALVLRLVRGVEAVQRRRT